ncbi:MAG: NAD-binding protein, partial [Candidatus Gastranaerophilales bacterium]|nr:NAD-binding protein [Candidatus Gastranaerophilales bacterium]
TRDNELFIPSGHTKLELNDKAFFMGMENALNILSRNYFFKKGNQIENVCIIGGGDAGFMLAKKLENIGLNVKVIEKDMQRCEFLADKLNSALILNSLGNDIEFLESEEIGNSDVVINLTSTDESNLLTSLLIKQLGVNRVIARVYDENIVNLFEKVGVDVAISPKTAVINELKNKILEKSSNILLTVEQNQADIIKALVPEKFYNKQLKEIKFPVKVVIGIIKRGNKIIIPKGDTLLRENDKMIIFTKSVDVPKLKEFIQK